jgi:hypothetical protein
MKVLDEPALKQSDRSVLNLQLKQLSKAAVMAQEVRKRRKKRRGG